MVKAFSRFSHTNNTIDNNDNKDSDDDDFAKHGITEGIPGDFEYIAKIFLPAH